MSSFASFSTVAVPRREKPLLWSHAISRITGDVDAKARLDHAFEGRVDYGSIGYLRICKIATTAAASVVAPRRAAAARDVIKLAIQQQGSGWYEQSGRSARLECGCWLAYDSAQPFSLTVPESSERYLLLVPKDMVPHIDLDAVLLRPFRADVGIGRIMCALVGNAFEEICSQNLEQRWALAGAMMQLIEQALTEQARAPRPASRKEVLRNRAKAFIHCHLRDPRLSVERVAQAISCSKRNLHKVFEEEGSTVGEFILRARLERCRKALLSEEFSARTITEIAMDHGFSSATHFSHAFKDAYGIAPREIRCSADYRTAVTCSARPSLPVGGMVDLRQ